MTGKVNDELLKQLAEAKKVDPHREIPVVITLTTGTDPSVLEQKGLKIHHIFKSISAVSGTLTALEINELVQSNQVERIEYDGTVHAL